MAAWQSDQPIVERRGNARRGPRVHSKGLAVKRRGTKWRMPNTEPEYGTLTKLALISERAQREPNCQFTSLAHLLDERFLEQGPGQWH